MIDHEFFDSIDTEEKAYILGYILADGHAVDPKHKRFRIQLACIDEDIIVKIGKAIGYEKELPQRVDHLERIRKGGNALFVFHFNSRGMWNKLNDLEATGSKCHRMLMPEISDAFKRHFARGYVDGDGSLVISKIDPKKNWRYRPDNEIQVQVAFCGGSWDVISTLTKWMNGRSRHKAKIEVGQTKSGRAFYRVGWCGSNGYRVAKWLYEKANIFIDRKMAKYKEIRKLYRSP